MIEKLQKTIVTTIDREMDPTIKEIRDKLPETYSNLDRSRDKFVSNLNNSVSKEIERFKTDFRIEMYARIEKDIGNKECKEIFKNECEQRTEKLRENIEWCFNECKKQFSKDIKEDIEQFEERIKNFLVMLNHINIDSGFDINIDTDSGINGLGLFSSIASLVFGIFNFWNFVGWASIGLGAIGAVKSVWSWFSSDYKKSQQRKEVDNNLDKVCGIIEKRVRNKIEDAKKGICEKVESLKARLNDLVVCYERMREGLIIARRAYGTYPITSKQGSHNE
ncbi:MICOS complex subunit MIC60 [Helicobacter pylori]|uniref:MICOS complex subunit MIC60 n=1 Tax=Helicobacter pylori TaxID=210 RepID=UPI001FD05256|nr:MICOS complex subunit MIC60 [Helicobacter pylori]UOS32013.1 MICOS complex subunit MIC60 [Helicobacter pylori]